MEEFCCEEIPMCTSCGHRHVQGIKCSICGHVGKSQIFVKMKTRANEKRKFKVEVYSGANISQEESKFDLIYELRRIVAMEANITTQDEFSIVEEQNAFHMVGLVGDAPGAVARYRLDHNHTESGVSLVIDRFAVLPEYRNRGIAYQCLFAILRQMSGVALNRICFAVSNTSWAAQKLVSFGFALQNDGIGISARGTETLVLNVGGSSLQEISVFLGEKAAKWK